MFDMSVSIDMEASDCKWLERERYKDENWTELRFFPTAGLNFSFVRPGVYSAPAVFDWRFSPTGLVGASVQENGTGFDVLLLDVHNKFWFGHSFVDTDIHFEDIFTYHMLNENTVILLDILNANLVRQNLFNVDLETRKLYMFILYGVSIVPTAGFDVFDQVIFVDRQKRVTFISYNGFASVHEFRHRPVLHSLAPWQAELKPCQHVPLFVNGKDYTALISCRNRINKRRIIYLVPRNPWNTKIQPMEFIFSTILTSENRLRLMRLIGPSYDRYAFKYAACSSADLIYLSPCISSTNRPPQYDHVQLGVYLTIDVSKLVDLYSEPDEPGSILYAQQVDSMELISYPFEMKLMQNCIKFSCGNDGSMLYLHPWGFSNVGENSYNTTCHVLQSNNTLTIKTDKKCWFNMHPCGAILQFRMSSTSLYVKVVLVYKDTLKSVAISKAMFGPDRSIDSIEGLHQMVFGGLKPIKLDKDAKMVTASHGEYSLLCHNYHSIQIPGTDDKEFTALSPSASSEYEEYYITKTGYFFNVIFILLLIAVLVYFVIHYFF